MLYDGSSIKSKEENSFFSKSKALPSEAITGSKLYFMRALIIGIQRVAWPNPQFNGVLQCLYVGMTSKTPKERFLQHKTGYRNKKGYKLSSNIVEKYGLYLRPSLYNHIEPMATRAEALKMEETLALELRRQRYAVWFN